MKKFLLFALVVIGMSMATAPRSNAGVSVNIGFGVPLAYGCSYPYYGYRYPYYSRPYYYSRPRVVVVRRPHYFWRHGHRLVRRY